MAVGTTPTDALLAFAEAATTITNALPDNGRLFADLKHLDAAERPYHKAGWDLSVVWWRFMTNVDNSNGKNGLHLHDPEYVSKMVTLDRVRRAR